MAQPARVDPTPGDPASQHINLGYHVQRGSLPYHERVAELAVKYSSDGDPVLDVGTGAGSVPAMVQQRARRTIDIADISQDCLTTAASRVDVRNAYLISEDYDVRAAIPQDTYAVVTMSHVLEHLNNPVQAVHDTLSLLRPGGHLVLAVPNPVRPFVLLASLLRRRYSNRGHVVAWDRSHWMNFLERIAKVDVAEYAVDYVQLTPRTWPPYLRPLERALVRLLPWYSFSHLAVVRRASA